MLMDKITFCRKIKVVWWARHPFPIHPPLKYLKNVVWQNQKMKRAQSDQSFDLGVHSDRYCMPQTFKRFVLKIKKTLLPNVHARQVATKPLEMLSSCHIQAFDTCLLYTSDAADD